MKQLILLRHGKSDWGDPGLSDHDRVLNTRGERDAPEMGRRLYAMNIHPDNIVCSTALRAVQTAEKFVVAFSYSREIIHAESALYLADLEDWWSVVRALDQQWNKIVMVGHNPGITEFANVFLEQKIEDMTTCGMLIMTFHCSSWLEVNKNCLSAFDYDYPKKIQLK